MPCNPAPVQPVRQWMYPSAAIALWLRFSGVPGRPKLNEIMEEGLHKVQLLLKRGPRGPLPFSFPEQLLGRSVCSLWACQARHVLCPNAGAGGAVNCKFSLCVGSVGFPFFHNVSFTGQVRVVYSRTTTSSGTLCHVRLSHVMSCPSS